MSTASHLSPTPKRTPQHIGACETSVRAVTCLKCPCWAYRCHPPRLTCSLALEQNGLPLALGLGAAPQGLGRVLAAWCTPGLSCTPQNQQGAQGTEGAPQGRGAKAEPSPLFLRRPRKPAPAEKKVPELRLREQRHCPYHPQHTHTPSFQGAWPQHPTKEEWQLRALSRHWSPSHPPSPTALWISQQAGTPWSPAPLPRGSPRSATLPWPRRTPGPDPSGSNRKPPREAG